MVHHREMCNLKSDVVRKYTGYLVRTSLTPKCQHQGGGGYGTFDMQENAHCKRYRESGIGHIYLNFTKVKYIFS